MGLCMYARCVQGGIESTVGKSREKGSEGHDFRVLFALSYVFCTLQRAQVNIDEWERMSWHAPPSTT